MKDLVKIQNMLLVIANKNTYSTDKFVSNERNIPCGLVLIKKSKA
jgi:hypothetical protein